MGTPFTDIYVKFLAQVKTHELANMPDTSLEENMQLWLTNSLGYFTACRKSLDYDLQLSSFDDELDNNEQTILAGYMAIEYLNTFLMKEQNLSQALNSKDYRMYSPANQLKALASTQVEMEARINTRLSRYSWNSKSIKGLFKS